MEKKEENEKGKKERKFFRSKEKANEQKIESKERRLGRLEKKVIEKEREREEKGERTFAHGHRRIDSEDQKTRTEFLFRKSVKKKVCERK